MSQNEDQNARDEANNAKHRAMITEESDAEGGIIKTIKLRKRAEHQGVKYESVRMREPTVNDHLLQSAGSKSDDAQKQAEIKLIAALCDVHPDMMKRLGLWDYKTLQLAFMDFVE